jgi:hypothetical protein
MYRPPSEQQRRESPDDTLPPPTFLGEERITGALVSMTLSSRPLVVFVYSGRQPALGPGGVYSAWGERLTRLKFDVQQWSPAGQMTPMGQMTRPSPMPEPKPGQKVIWILLPDNSDPRMAMMMGGPNATEAVRQRIEAGDSSLVIVAYNRGSMLGAADPLVQMLDVWGIKVQPDRIVLQEVPRPRREPEATPVITVTDWPQGHIISKSLAGLPGVIQVGVPLDLATSKDKSVTLSPILEARGPRLWAEKDLRENQMPKRDPKTAKDVYVIGAAAQGKSGRLVVIGDAAFGGNDVLTLGQDGPGTAEFSGAMFPGNAELLVNSLYWLGGMEQLIAASPRTQDIARIEQIAPGTLSLLKWSLIAGLPVVALVCGVGVWLARRRG